MLAPVALAHSHVHSMRLASGAEVLIARVLIAQADGETREGFGFTPNQEAVFARDMATWDALARSRGVPLGRLLGGSGPARIAVDTDPRAPLAADWAALRAAILEKRHDVLRIEPWRWSTIEQLAKIAALAARHEQAIGWVAPHAHPWELAFCAALAAALPGKGSRILVPAAGPHPHSPITVPEDPGVGIAWCLEPGFAQLNWQTGA